MALCVDCSPARLLYASFQKISLRTKAPACRGAAPPLLAQMLAPRAFAAGEADTGESCASPPPPRSDRCLACSRLVGHRIIPVLEPVCVYLLPCNCKKLPAGLVAESYAATVLAAAYLNLKGSPHFYQMSILSRR